MEQHGTKHDKKQFFYGRWFCRYLCSIKNIQSGGNKKYLYNTGRGGNVCRTQIFIKLLCEINSLWFQTIPLMDHESRADLLFPGDLVYQVALLPWYLQIPSNEHICGVWILCFHNFSGNSVKWRKKVLTLHDHDSTGGGSSGLLREVQRGYYLELKPSWDDTVSGSFHRSF